MSILSSASFAITGITIYISCIVITVTLTIYAHKKYQDPCFLQGIFLSTLFHLLLLLPNIYLIFLPIIYVLGLIFGIVAGIYNINVKRGALCGALGVLISWTSYGVLTYNTIIYLFSVNLFLVYLLPAIMFGAIGGVGGHKIRERKIEKKTQKVLT